MRLSYQSMDINELNKCYVFITFFKFIVTRVSNKIPNRTKKKFTFKNILYCCLYMNGNSCSYSGTNLHMYINDIINVSDMALIKRRDSISYKFFREINNEILNFIYGNNKSPRVIAVDGTYISLSINYY
jgi:hypothetical protein